MPKRTSNQSGAAMIMFAMVMLIVLSLISVGFAFLVRNDQRQTLDKTLSNQAQYAAETVANRVSKGLKAGTITNATNTDCTDASYNVPYALNAASFPDIQITCVNWDAEPQVVTINNIGESPKSVKIKPPTGLTVRYFAVRWTMPPGCVPGSNAQFLDTLDSPNACPYLKVSMSDSSVVYSGRGTMVYSRPQINPAAFPPSSPGAGYSYAEQTAGQPYGGQQSGNPSGEIDNTYCAQGFCLIRITPPAGWTAGTNGLVSFSTIGGDVDVEISAYTIPYNAADSSQFFPALNVAPVLWAANRANLLEAQAVVDVTAKSTDVIRRIRVAAPIGKDTWTPGMAVIANTICKNYKLNGVNNDEQPPYAGSYPACY